MKLFEDSGDYLAFLGVLAEALNEREKTMRLCAYCLMPNHFHLVLWPAKDGQLSRFMQWVTMTHAQRWHAHRHSGGRGHLYQSRFKSFPIQQDGHFLKVCRYVEGNAKKAGLVQRAEDWKWSSLWARENISEGKNADEGVGGALGKVLSPWPVAMPRGWSKRVNDPHNEKELAELRRCKERGRPFGEGEWTATTAKRLGIESSMRDPGRPKKKEAGDQKKGL
jgi:putative transposase